MAHWMLEEVGADYETRVLSFDKGDNKSAEFLAINPRATIPTLVPDEGPALTDFRSIALWLAARHPKKGLIPADECVRGRALDAMDHAIQVMHGEGYTRIFVSDRYAVDAADRAEVEREGRAVVERGFAKLEGMFKDMEVSKDLAVAFKQVRFVGSWRCSVCCVVACVAL